MDIRAPGPLQANYTLDRPGTVASEFRASEIPRGDFGEGKRKGPAPKAHRRTAPTKRRQTSGQRWKGKEIAFWLT